MRSRVRGRAGEVRATDRGRIAVISLLGEFDLGVRRQFWDLLYKIDWQRTQRVIVDLRRVTFIGPAGVRMLLELWSRSQLDGFTLAVVPGGREVQWALAGVGLDSQLPMVDV
jgi:anti-anti-sigma factor